MWRHYIINYDAKELKYKYQMGVVSPVVYTLTYVYLIINFIFLIEVNALNTPPRNYKRKLET